MELGLSSRFPKKASDHLFGSNRHQCYRAPRNQLRLDGGPEKKLPQRVDEARKQNAKTPRRRGATGPEPDLRPLHTEIPPHQRVAQLNQERAPKALTLRLRAFALSVFTPIDPFLASSARAQENHANTKNSLAIMFIEQMVGTF